MEKFTWKFFSPGAGFNRGVEISALVAQALAIKFKFASTKLKTKLAIAIFARRQNNRPRAFPKNNKTVNDSYRCNKLNHLNDRITIVFA